MGTAVNEVEGDLFSCPETNSLAHCVSADLKMHRGIGKTFKKKFGKLTELQKQNKIPGEVAVLKKGTQFIFYLMIKNKCFDKTDPQVFKQAVLHLRELCIQEGVKNVAMPQIGCGLGHLKWQDVKALLDEIFCDVQVSVTIYKLPEEIKGVSDFAMKEVTGDLFSCPQTYSLAHCVSANLEMGKGIAVDFKKKFDGVQQLKKQQKKPGEVAVLKRGMRFIFYLITKDKYSDKPDPQVLKQTLICLKRICKEEKVKELAVPRIGCGLDGLQWPEVREFLNEVFCDSDIVVTVYNNDTTGP